MVEFLDHRGALSTDGKQLQEWIVAQFQEADKASNLEQLNSLSGPIAHYYVNVFKTKFITPERWFKECESFARNAWDIKVYVEEKALKEAQTAATANEANTKADTIADELRKFKESVAEQVAELEKANADLQAKLDAALAAKAGRKAKPETEEKPEAEVASEEA